MDWIASFEKYFQIKKIKNQNFKIIIGQQRYLQYIGKNEIYVRATNDLNIYYKGFGEVAFLVNNWIKVQDSLEMVFNLLTGDSVKSLKVLAYLRENEISTIEFANYLCEERKLLLINRFVDKKKELKNDSIITELVRQINTEKKLPVSLLFVGDNNNLPELIEYNGMLNKIGQIIHCSGQNLTFHSEKYKKTWYDFDNSCVENKASNNKETISLGDFHIL